MNIQQTEHDYLNKKTEKQHYIEQMHNEYHRVLFEYSQFLKNRDIKKIEITDDDVIMTTRELGIKMHCSKDDYRDIPIEILNFREYEKRDSDMILHLVKDGDCVFDIGGNMGWYTIALAKTKKEVTLHTFEPIKNTYNNLKRNVELNEINVNLHNIGLSDQEGELTFYFYKECSGNASMALMNDDKENVKVQCRVETIDGFCQKQKIEKIDFIKCDVEGAELLTFKGGYAAIKRFQPIVFTEMLRKWSAKFHYHPNETLAFFNDLGYRCFYTDGQGLQEFFTMDDTTVQSNFFFLHGIKHRDLINTLVN